MTWTKELPKKEGFYFWKKRKNAKWQTWGVRVLLRKEGWFSADGEDGIDIEGTYLHSGYWYGPIKLPK